MSEAGFKRDDGRWFLNAYYYSFTATGSDPIDAVLSCVAMAGKGYHLTEDWMTPGKNGLSCVDHIQQSAEAAAKALTEARAEIEALHVELETQKLAAAAAAWYFDQSRFKVSPVGYEDAYYLHDHGEKLGQTCRPIRTLDGYNWPSVYMALKRAQQIERED